MNLNKQTEWGTPGPDVGHIICLELRGFSSSMHAQERGREAAGRERDNLLTVFAWDQDRCGLTGAVLSAWLAPFPPSERQLNPTCAGALAPLLLSPPSPATAQGFLSATAMISQARVKAQDLAGCVYLFRDVKFPSQTTSSVRHLEHVP